MSSGAAYFTFYRALFAELSPLVRRWGNLEAESSSHFATLANIARRIKMVKENPKELGILLAFENLPEQMISIQFSGLESVMQTLRTALYDPKFILLNSQFCAVLTSNLMYSDIFESIVIDMEEINARSKEYYAQNPISSEDLLHVRPASASAAQSIEWIETIAQVHRKELLEKRNILEKVKYDNSDGISFLYEQWCRPIHIDSPTSTTLLSWIHVDFSITFSHTLTILPQFKTILLVEKALNWIEPS